MNRRSIAGAVLTAGLLLSSCLLIARGQSSRPGWGSTLYADPGGTGSTFRVWAPNASAVYVAGQFNGWSSSANPLTLEAVTSGVWSADVSGAAAGQNYKFVINNGGDLWRSDPRSRVVNSADNYNSVIVNTNSYSWTGELDTTPQTRDLVIYEMHMGTYNDLNTGDGLSATFLNATGRLDHLVNLGVNAVELMPVNEFPTAKSWGYNPAYPFAVENDFGTPDDLKTFINECHKRGISVLLDVVHNHWDGAGLWQYDGWNENGRGGIYFYNEDYYCCTDWGPRPDYRRDEVSNYILDTFRMWIEEYHFDGFRWDAPLTMIWVYTDTGWEVVWDGYYLSIEALNMMAAEYPGIINIAENIRWLNGFDAYWDTAFPSDVGYVLNRSSDSERSMATIAASLDPSAGSYQRVIYTESHDTTGDLNGGERVPKAIDPSDPDSYWARKRSHLGAVLTLTSPGIPMILQGQEMLEPEQFSDSRPVDWSKTNTYRRTVRLYHDLIDLRRNRLQIAGGLQGEGYDTFLANESAKMVGLHRWNAETPGEDVVVVMHFADGNVAHYPVFFPEPGTWYVHMNTDATTYGSDYGNYGETEVEADETGMALVDIGPYSALVFSTVPEAPIVDSHVLDDSLTGNANGSADPDETVEETIVLRNTAHSNVTNITISVTSGDPGITVPSNNIAFVDIPSGGTSTGAVPVQYAIDRYVPCGSTVELQVASFYNGTSFTESIFRVVGRLASVETSSVSFASTDVPVLILDNQIVSSDLTIENVGFVELLDVNVSIRLDHTWVSDLDIILQHPDGTEVALFNRRGGSGDNFGTGDCTNGIFTIFDQQASQSIASAAAPFAGSYEPDGDLAALNGRHLAGTWHLKISDNYGGDQGAILCWGIDIVGVDQEYACAVSNHPPVATGAVVLAAGDTSTNAPLSGADPDGDPISFEVLSNAIHGVTDLNTSSWDLAYAPAHGYRGTDTVVFVARDAFSTSIETSVIFTITAPADSDLDGMPNWWEEPYFTNFALGLPWEDSDGDRIPNIIEFRANTNPRDSNSFLRSTEVTLSNGIAGVGWTSVGGTRYRVEYSDNIISSNFTGIARPPEEEIDTNARGVEASMSYSDQYLLTPQPTNGIRTYRIRAVDE